MGGDPCDASRHHDTTHQEQVLRYLQVSVRANEVRSSRKKADKPSLDLTATSAGGPHQEITITRCSSSYVQLRTLRHAHRPTSLVHLTRTASESASTREASKSDEEKSWWTQQETCRTFAVQQCSFHKPSAPAARYVKTYNAASAMLSMSFKGVRGLPRSPDGSSPSEEKGVWLIQVQHGRQRHRTRPIDLAHSEKVGFFFRPAAVATRPQPDGDGGKR